MSSKGVRQRRCIVQKLDFENCIITNLKTSSSGKKKLRARITREIELIPDVSEEKAGKKSCEKSTSPVLTRASSPVLLKKQRQTDRSPILSKRKKSAEIDIEEFSEESEVLQTPSPSSPVFKTFKKHKMVNISPTPKGNPLDRSTSSEAFISQADSSSGVESSFQIEDFTQESKQSAKICSVESPESKVAALVEQKSSFHFNSITNYSKNEEGSDSVKPIKKNYRKNSLLGRLQKLQQKQASEKLLWQHQNRKKSSNGLTMSVLNFWNGEFNYFLKCQSSFPDFKTTFLVIDSRWVPKVKTVKEGSMLELQPPWQKLYTEGTKYTVLLNVVCLDILDEIKEPILRENSFEVVPIDLFKSEEKVFINSLFSCYDSKLLF